METQSTIEELLIITKTYPMPSKKHRETTCVAAITRSGLLRRIFPVPYRFLEGEDQFKKWEWIKARLFKASKDHRPESYQVEVDSIVRSNKIIGTENAWDERRRWIEPHVVDNFEHLQQQREATRKSLGIIKPARLLGLDITPEKNPEWNEEEKSSLLQQGLFDGNNAQLRSQLRKLPYQFHYRYECHLPNGDVKQYRHMISDWEVGALYWNCQRSHDVPGWEKPFRQKLEQSFSQKDLFLLMGTIHRFPDQWLIIGLIYPPKIPMRQQRLVLD